MSKNRRQKTEDKIKRVKSKTQNTKHTKEEIEV